SHELRTPIQAIEGHLSLIMRWGKDDPKVLDESLNTALDEVKRMKKMIEELLDLARKVEKEEAYSDVEKVLKSVTEELEVVYPNVTINIETMGDKRMVPITEHALAQIARNIIENGICYNDKDPIINIYVKYFTKDIIMTIQDNGIGIKKEHLPFIFDRFYRIDPSRSYHGGGTGLGLSITKMLAEKYGIGMDVASFVGEGTTFTLRFST
ncbi:MAG: HAMP domain-containing histidine kinase, partial [Lysinibacillus sp.]|nr:HAMP domain-containing histidine kinase [Lysinibacillus sp.]